MNIGIEDYRKYIKFDDPHVSLADRAKYLLFFVTRLAELRDDMTPAVIADRLNDWGYPGVTVEEIVLAFAYDPDVIPSKAREGAYTITQVAQKRIYENLKSIETKTWHKTLLQSMLIVVAVSMIALLSIVGYNFATGKEMVRDLSFPEFRRRIQFDEPTTSPAQRAKYFLYFITKVMQLREDMTAEVIEERLLDIGYNEMTAAEINQTFSLDPDIRPSVHRPDAFEISPIALEKFEIMLDIQVPATEVLTMAWLWRHIPFKGWLSLITGLVGLISSSFSLGYWIAVQSPSKNK